MLNQPDLLKKIEEYCATHGMTQSAFGREFMRDPSLVGDMRYRQRECLPSTQAILLKAMESPPPTSHSKGNK